MLQTKTLELSADTGSHEFNRSVKVCSLHHHYLSPKPETLATYPISTQVTALCNHKPCKLLDVQLSGTLADRSFTNLA